MSTLPVLGVSGIMSPIKTAGRTISPEMIGKTKADFPLPKASPGTTAQQMPCPRRPRPRPDGAAAPGPGLNSEKIGDARDDTFLDFRNRAVGESDLPHHRDDLLPALLIEDFGQRVGEMVEIDGLAILRFGKLDQARRRLGIETKPVFDEFTQPFALRCVDMAVGSGEMDEERNGGEAKVIRGEIAPFRCTGKFRDEIFEAIEHYSPLHPRGHISAKADTSSRRECPDKGAVPRAASAGTRAARGSTAFRLAN